MCTVLTDLLAWLCWKLIYMYIARWCMSEIIDFFEISIGSCKLCNLRFFANKLACMDLTALYINPILLKIDIHVRNTMMFVWNNWFLWKHYWYLQIYATVWFLQILFMCTVLTDLLLQFCWRWNSCTFNDVASLNYLISSKLPLFCAYKYIL